MKNLLKKKIYFPQIGPLRIERCNFLVEKISDKIIKPKTVTKTEDVERKGYNFYPQIVDLKKAIENKSSWDAEETLSKWKVT